MVPYKGRKFDARKEIWVYRNLHRKGGPWYSVMQDGKVVARTKAIMMTDVRFVVREAGRQRCLIERKKNVHAFVVGHLTYYDTVRLPGGSQYCRGLYDPYVCGHFRFIDPEGTERWMETADFITLDGGGLRVKGAA